MRRIEGYFTKFERVFVCLLILAMTGLSFLEVILRNFFHTGLPWLDVFLRHSVLWLALVGASLAASEMRHIKLDILVRLIPPAFSAAAGMVVSLFSSGVCLLLARASWLFVASEREFESTIYADIPAWPFEIILPLGFLVLGFKFFVRFLDNLSFKRQS